MLSMWRETAATSRPPSSHSDSYTMRDLRLTLGRVARDTAFAATSSG